MKEKILIGLQYAFLTVAALLFIFPFIWMIIGITNVSSDITQGVLSIGDAFMDNVHTVMTQTDFVRAFFNSTIIAILVVGLTLLITSMAAYSFQFFPSMRKERLYNIMILSMMIPFAALMIPLFKMTAAMGWVDTYRAIILQAIPSVFMVFFFRQSIRSFPFELIESARIEGCTEFKIFTTIFVPNMKATYVAALIYVFLGSWNSYMWPLISNQSSEMQTLPLLISNLSTSYSPDYGAMLVAIVFTTIPTLVVFLVAQKHFVEGMVGSGK